MWTYPKYQAWATKRSSRSSEVCMLWLGVCIPLPDFFFSRRSLSKILFSFSSFHIQCKLLCLIHRAGRAAWGFGLQPRSLLLNNKGWFMTKSKGHKWTLSASRYIIVTAIIHSHTICYYIHHWHWKDLRCYKWLHSSHHAIHPILFRLWHIKQATAYGWR